MQEVVIGLDVGGTKVLAGVVSRDGRALALKRRGTRPAHYLQDLTDLATDLLSEADAIGCVVKGVGIGTTGMVDSDAGVLRASLGLGLFDVPIRDHLEQALGLPVSVDNDIHAAALGELAFGVGHHHSDFIVFNAGTGLSVGLVIGGKLIRGVTNCAGEVGHTVLNYAGESCNCGLPGCAEAEVVRARTNVDPVGAHSGAVSESPYHLLALVATSLVNLLNPSALVLVGGMFTENPDASAEVMTAIVESSLPQARLGLSYVGVSKLGSNAGLVGAASLALQDLHEEASRRVESSSA